MMRDKGACILRLNRGGNRDRLIVTPRSRNGPLFSRAHMQPPWAMGQGCARATELKRERMPRGQGCHVATGRQSTCSLHSLHTVCTQSARSLHAVCTNLHVNLHQSTRQSTPIYTSGRFTKQTLRAPSQQRAFYPALWHQRLQVLDGA